MSIICIHSAGCTTTTAIPDQNRPQTWAKLISKPENFYQVDKDLFRSEQPDQDIIQNIQTQHISVVINLRASNSDQPLFKNHPEIKTVHIPINTWAINRNDLLKVMQTIQQEKRLHKNVLIHCYHGSDRTGASIAMYRIIFENWSIHDAINEMKYGGFGFHPIWVNIENLFTPENVKWIREQLANPSS